MSPKFRVVALSVVAIGVSLLVSVSARAKLPPECVERFESKVDGHVGAIDEAMNSRGRLADIGNKLLLVRGEALRYIKGNWAKDCADAAPENRERMNGYIQTKLVPALETLAKGFVGVCVKYGKERIAERTKAMEKAASTGKPGVIDAQISYLETTLRRDGVLKMCKPIQAEVARLKDGRFAELKREAQIVRAKKKLAACALPVKRWEKVAKGLADGKKGKLYEIAVPDERDIKREVEVCQTVIDDALGLGLEASSLVAPIDRANRPLPEVTDIIARLSADPPALIARIRKHNAKWKKWYLGKWTRENIRGSGMRKVYKAYGVDVLPRVRDLGSRIVWTYRTSYSNRALAECEEYTFSKKGSLKSRRAYGCQ